MGATKYPLVHAPGGGTPNLPGPGQPAPLRSDEFQTGSVANAVQFRFADVDPPSSLYVQRDDKLQLVMASNVSGGEIVSFVIRLLRSGDPQGGQPSEGGVGRHPGGIITRGFVQTELEKLTIPGTGTTFKTINMAEGYLLSIGAVASLATTRGQTYARGTLVRTSDPIVPFTQPLFADYVTLAHATGYPGGRIIHPVESTGWLRSQQVANPAAGADWIFTAGATARVALRSFSSTFITSATVANRAINVIVDDGANIVWQDDLAVNVTASQTVGVNAAQVNVPTGVITGELFVTLPPGLVLGPGWRLRTSTTGLQAADQWTLIWLNVETWLDLV